MGRRDLPSGTVTLLFTDVEGSTRVLQELGEAAYADVLSEHRRTLRETFAGAGGIEVDTEGDAVFAAFPTAIGALSAARKAQAEFESGPLRVRMGLHTGTPLRTDEGYVGVDVHRAARIGAAGHGGQVLISATTAALVAEASVPLTDLGEHRLKDMARPERIYQLGDRGFPPLRSLSPSNLPVPAGPFVGRAAELVALGELLRDPARRLVTLLGTGGIGKTRLALEAAAEAQAAFPDGRWWVSLAPLGDPALVLPAVAQALGLTGSGAAAGVSDVAAHLAGRRMLLVLDNAEHLQPALADVIAEMLPASEGSTLLVTSRDRLSLASEQVFRVPVLSGTDARDLLIARGAAVGVTVPASEAATTICERLDRLPLAIQLAAARLPILSVEQLLERLSGRLDLLAGDRDLDPRQRTLRATIEWSHDLLSSEEQELFRRLSVFPAGCTLEAAEAVAAAGIGTLQGLVDKSLLQHRDDTREPRFWMLESIAQFAAERLAAAEDERATRERHAAWCLELAERVDERLRSGEPEERWVALLEPEIDNLRAAVAFGTEIGDHQLVRRIAAALPMLWLMNGRLAEGRTWTEQALAVDAAEDDTRRRLLSGVALLAYLQGDYAAATVAADDAAALASRLGPETGRYAAIRQQAGAALMHEDFLAAEPLFKAGLAAATEDDNGVGMSSCRINLAYVANRTSRHEEAESWLSENLPFVRGRGQARCEANTLVALGETFVYLDRPAEAIDHLAAATTVVPRAADALLLIEALRWYASAAASLGDAGQAALILGACEAAEAETEAALEPHERAARDELIRTLTAALGTSGFEATRERGRALDLAAAARLVQARPAMAASAAR
jgi:predicted ATPase/class 3 adenylate cyclase